MKVASTSSSSRGEYRSRPRRVTSISVTRGSISDPGRNVAGLVLGVTVPDLLGDGGGEPVVLRVDSLAIVDDHPELARGHAILRSLHAQAEQRGLTTPAHLLTAPGDPALDGYSADPRNRCSLAGALDTRRLTAPALGPPARGRRVQQTPFMSRSVAGTGDSARHERCAFSCPSSVTRGVRRFASLRWSARSGLRTLRRGTSRWHRPHVCPTRSTRSSWREPNRHRRRRRAALAHRWRVTRSGAPPA